MSTSKEALLSRLLQPETSSGNSEKPVHSLIQEVNSDSNSGSSGVVEVLPNPTAPKADVATVPVEDSGPSILEMMMAAQREAKAEKEKDKAIEQTVASTKPLGGGFKKGFFGGGGGGGNSSKKASELKKISSADVVEVKKQADKKSNPLVFDDVQKAMEEDQHPLLKQLKQNDWITPDLTQQFQSNEVLKRGFQDPKCMAAMQLLQKNPKEAQQKFQNDPEVSRFLQEFGKMMAGHFEGLAAKQAGGGSGDSSSSSSSSGSKSASGVSELSADHIRISSSSNSSGGTSGGGDGKIQEIGPLHAQVLQKKQQPQLSQQSQAASGGSSSSGALSKASSTPTTSSSSKVVVAPSSSSSSSSSVSRGTPATPASTSASSADEEERVKQILQDEELRAMLMDPDLQRILLECGDPAKFQQHMRNPDTYRKIVRLQKAGLVGTARFKEIVAMKGSPELLARRLPLAKIVATIGPASENLPMLSHVVDAGMRIMRINFSHATYEEADLRVGNLSKCVGTTQPNGIAADGHAHLRAVMLDTQGPEIRTGSFGGDVKEVELFIDQMITLTNDPSVRTEQTASKIWVSYTKLHETVSHGSSILLDDGAVEVVVEDKGTVHGEVSCRVKNHGFLGNKKGVNMPGLPVDLPAMCEKDKVDIRWGIANNIDYIAASFVRKASDVTEIRAYTQQLLKEKFPGGAPATNPVPHVISKIESVEALVNFDSILEVSDGIMVARGDLAVEIPMESLANVQKEIVRRCNLAGKPVIVATQMLESMQKNPRPTRAECTDVANAIFDGADCVMLSGESAKGRYPVECISLMNRIVQQSELAMAETEPLVPRPTPAPQCTTEAFGYTVAQAATAQRANPAVTAIVLHCDNPRAIQLAKHVSKHRPHLPVFCVVANYKEGRLLQVFKNLHPVVVPAGAHDDKQILAHLHNLGFLKSADQALMVREHCIQLTTV